MPARASSFLFLKLRLQVFQQPPVGDFGRFQNWALRGLAGEMRYLTDHRASLRSDPDLLLPGVRTVISVGMLYEGPESHSTEVLDPGSGCSR